ncbi:hypothetical protein [Nonomuraea sp. NPDC049309]|uniref:hypothetical protein n=1 Tax=Nonomuraea sp. NPDC049309 TaxID=3364350 RepID=UPI00371D2727
MTLRPDGRPIIAYFDALDDSIGLLDCRDRACAQAGRIQVARRGSEPAVALDAAGRALVAYHDYDTDQMKLATCWNSTCASTVVSGEAGADVDMTLDDHGRPVIAWTTVSEGVRSVRVTTVLNVGDITTRALESAGRTVHGR